MSLRLSLSVDRNRLIAAPSFLMRATTCTFTTELSENEMIDPRGNWGGLIINGNAPVSTAGGESFVEGLEGVSFKMSCLDIHPFNIRNRTRMIAGGMLNLFILGVRR